MAEEATVPTTDPELAFEEVEITPEELKELSTDEPTTDSPEESEVEDEPEVPEVEAEEVETEETKEEPVDQKAHNREMALKRLKEKQEREKATRDYQQQFLADADKENPADNDVIRQLQVDAYNNKIEFNNSKLETDYDRAVRDFEIFSDQSPEIQEELTAALEAFNDAYVEKDKFGNPYKVRGSLYQHLQAKADSIKRLTGLGATKQTESKSKEKSKVTLVPSRTPKEPKADPGLDAFDEEASRW